MLAETIIAVLLLIVGSGVGALALLCFGHSLIRVLTWTSAHGEIVGFDRAHGCFLPRVRFTTSGGTVVEFTSSGGRGKRPYREGDPVRVVYRASPPHPAEIRSFQSLWLLPIVLALLSGMMIVGTLHQWPA